MNTTLFDKNCVACIAKNSTIMKYHRAEMKDKNLSNKKLKEVGQKRNFVLHST